MTGIRFRIPAYFSAKRAAEWQQTFVWSLAKAPIAFRFS